MPKSPLLKNILSALAVAGFGFVLLNLTFLFYALYHNIIRTFILLDLTQDLIPPVMHGSFVVVIGLISWLVWRTKWGVLTKAIYLTMPCTVVFVTIGMFLSNWPVLVYSLDGLFGMGVLYYFYHTKQPWLYYYSVILVGLTLAIFTLAGEEI